MKHREWFREWFDSPYYHILYANRSTEEAAAFIGRVIEKLKIPTGSSVLDVACGKGRHSVTMAKAGLHVTGIDLSPHNIEYAKKFESENLHFEVWDMRQLYREAAFDYVFNLFSSFGYFDDDKDDEVAICAFAGSLKPGGTLLLDYMNTECTVKQLKSHQIVPRGEIQFHIQKKIEKGFIKKKIEFLANGEHFSFEEHLKIINRYKFEQMLHSAGMEVTQTFGDYDLSDFNPGASQRLILVAVKK